MGDYQDFCESFGGCASDPDFMDDWLDKYARDDRPVKTKPKIRVATHTREIRSSETLVSQRLQPGKLIHMVQLTGDRPAKAIRALWDITLKNVLVCHKANFLTSVDYNDPASWFVENGFTVRSMKENDKWYQVIFKSTNEETALSDQKKKEYESMAFNSEKSS